MKRHFCLLSSTGLLALACGGSPAPLPETPAAEEPKEEQIDARYRALPTPTAAPNWAPPGATKTPLNNGLSVWHMDHGSQPLVAIHLILPTGSASDPKDKSGLTRLSADMLDEGAGKLSALELSDRLGELATDYSADAGVDYVLISMNALAENLDASLGVLADIVQRPSLTKEEFERRKKYHLAVALAAKDDPRQARSKALAHALFGNAYASDSPSGTENSLGALQLGDVKTRVKQMAVPGGASLVIAGSTDQALAQKMVEKHFGKWQGKQTKADPVVAKAPTGGTAYVVDFPGASQSSLAIAMRAGSDKDPNYFAEEVMHQKLGGSFTGRINMNLREDKGYTYGARSVFRRYAKAGYFAVMADVKSETTGASVSEVFKELQDVCGDRPLTDLELKESVDGMLLGYPMDFDKISSTGYRLASLPIRRRPVDYWTTWPSKIREITTARANAAAQPYCKPGTYDVVVAGDLASVAPALEKLGLKVVELDKDGLPIKEATAQASEAAAH